ncbi:hypothetical protein TNCV_4484561 [Trichonephila clavipes]|nr:hypothetical protein TNCV_4484561 [Trichonephila clavipes]
MPINEKLYAVQSWKKAFRTMWLKYQSQVQELLRITLQVSTVIINITTLDDSVEAVWLRAGVLKSADSITASPLYGRDLIVRQEASAASIRNKDYPSHESSQNLNVFLARFSMTKEIKKNENEVRKAITFPEVGEKTHPCVKCDDV